MPTVATGGYAALARAIAIGPAGVIREVLASKLMGRGGAAFPTGRKWDAVAEGRGPAPLRGLQCRRVGARHVQGPRPDGGRSVRRARGDDDRGLRDRERRGYLYIRGEYPLAARRMGAAIVAARAAGWLGDEYPRTRASRSTSSCAAARAPTSAARRRRLFNSIEGKRGEPRNKPPFPVQAGLFGKPTVINNVETLVNIPPILREGGEIYAGIGTSGSTGPKLFCVSGHVARPGVYEVDFGITLGELIAMAGGVPGGKAIRAVLLGGAAGVFVGPDKLDIPLTFEGTRAASATLGSGVVMVFDESVDLGDILLRIAAFFRDESCGQCVPCRVGTVRQEELLQRIRSGRPIGDRAEELALLQEIGQVMRDASICGLGQTGVERHRVGAGDARSLPEAGDPNHERRFPLVPTAAASQQPSVCSSAAGAHGRRHRHRRPAGQGAVIVDDPGGMPVAGDRHADALLPREPHAGERLPRLRGGGRGLADPGPGLFATGRAGDGYPDRLAARPPVAEDGARVPRLIRGPLHGPAGP